MLPFYVCQEPIRRTIASVHRLDDNVTVSACLPLRLSLTLVVQVVTNVMQFDEKGALTGFLVRALLPHHCTCTAN